MEPSVACWRRYYAIIEPPRQKFWMWGIPGVILSMPMGVLGLVLLIVVVVWLARAVASGRLSLPILGGLHHHYARV
jgi:hypothetical protein